MKNNTSKDLARYIDHAVLNPELTKQDIIEKINIGVQYHCQTVCVNPSAIDIAKECIKKKLSKQLTLEITKITEQDYNMLVKEVQKETKAK